MFNKANQNNAYFIGMGQKKLAAHISFAVECHIHSRKGNLTDKICFLMPVIGSGEGQTALLFLWWLIMNVTEKILYLKQHDPMKKTTKLIYLITKKSKNEVRGIWRHNFFFNKDPEIMI